MSPPEQGIESVVPGRQVVDGSIRLAKLPDSYKPLKSGDSVGVLVPQPYGRQLNLRASNPDMNVYVALQQGLVIGQLVDLASPNQQQHPQADGGHQ